MNTTAIILLPAFIATALLPVFAVILIGYILRKSNLIGQDEWPAINHLCYYVLFPTLIIKTLALADLSSTPTAPIAFTMLCAVSVMSALLFIMRKPISSFLSLDPPSYTSLFQGSTRWNTFAALAVIAALYGNEGLTIATIGIAVMIPLLNLTNVTILSLYGHSETAHRAHPWRMLIRNPFIIACTIGIALNMLDLKLPLGVISVLDMVGRGALGISLLTVGAALQLKAIKGNLAAIFTASALRLVIMPALMTGFGLLFGLTDKTLVIAVICAAVPTASASFILARKMGGNAELMAAIVSFQVLAAILTLPLAISMATLLGG